MYPFKYIIEIDDNSNSVSLSLIETNDTDDNHTYDLVFPEELRDRPDLRIFVAIKMTHWMNTEGKKQTFKYIVSYYTKLCKGIKVLKV